jgi:prevent-host-death family protein
MQVAVREFKANLSEYLARVQAGETLEITSHKKPIARVMSVDKTTDDKLREMAAKGMLTLPTKPFRLPKPVKLSPGPLISDLVIQERREGP